MPIVQTSFAFARPLQARVRSVRRPFHPSTSDQGPYRLPHDVRDRLTSSLAPFRNREAAFALATFIARYWSVPGRLVGPGFPIDRRALADHADLNLTEARVRGAILTLEAVGYLERAIPAPGSRYKATEEGLHRKPILFAFGTDYAASFIEANKRAQRARTRRLGERRPIVPAASSRPSTRLLTARHTSSPKNKSVSVSNVLMGDLTKERGSHPLPISASNPLDVALEKLRQAIGLTHKA